MNAPRALPRVTFRFLSQVHSLLCVSDWSARDEWFQRLENTVLQQILRGDQPSVQPFHAVAYPMNGPLALEISRKYAERVTAVARSLKPHLEFQHTSAFMPDFERGERLRIGYISSDFGNHPLAHLMMSVFGLHDRSKLEVFCYALSKPDGSEWQQCISSEAEHFGMCSHL